MSQYVTVVTVVKILQTQSTHLKIFAVPSLKSKTTNKIVYPNKIPTSKISAKQHYYITLRSTNRININRG